MEYNKAYDLQLGKDNIWSFFKADLYVQIFCFVISVLFFREMKDYEDESDLKEN